MLILPILMEYLVGQFGWRGAMAVYGVMNLNICVAGSLMREPAPADVKPSSGDTNSTDRSIEVNLGTGRSIESLLHDDGKKKNIFSKLIANIVESFGFSTLIKNRLLVVYLCAMALHELVLSGWILFLVSYAVSLGYTPMAASVFAGVGGGGASLGRLLVWPLTDSGLLKGLTMFFALALGGSMSLGCYMLSDGYWALMAISFVTGLCLATTAPVYIIILKEMYPENTTNFTNAIGLKYMFRGFGTLAGGPLTGMLAKNNNLSFSLLIVYVYGSFFLKYQEYDTENHTEKCKHTEAPLKTH